MRKIPLGAYFTVVFVIASILSWKYSSVANDPLRSCGHRRSVLWELSPIQGSHCCLAGPLVNSLQELYLIQGQHLRDNPNASPLTIDELPENLRDDLRDAGAELIISGSTWNCSVVAEPAHLPGSYRISSEGKVLFRETGAEIQCRA